MSAAYVKSQLSGQTCVIEFFHPQSNSLPGSLLSKIAEEITIAGNLTDIYRNIVAIGNDYDDRGNTECGSIVVENMTIAGS